MYNLIYFLLNPVYFNYLLLYLPTHKVFHITVIILLLYLLVILATTCSICYGVHTNPTLAKLNNKGQTRNSNYVKYG